MSKYFWWFIKDALIALSSAIAITAMFFLWRAFQ